MSKLKPLLACAATVLLCALPMSARADTVSSAEMSITTDDNITAARDGHHRTTEQALQLGLVQALSSSVNRSTSLRLLARAGGRFHARYEGLNEFSGGLDGQLLLRVMAKPRQRGTARWRGHGGIRIALLLLRLWRRGGLVTLF